MKDKEKLRRHLLVDHKQPVSPALSLQSLNMSHRDIHGPRWLRALVSWMWERRLIGPGHTH